MKVLVLQLHIVASSYINTYYTVPVLCTYMHVMFLLLPLVLSSTWQNQIIVDSSGVVQPGKVNGDWPERFLKNIGELAMFYDKWSYNMCGELKSQFYDVIIHS